MSDKNNSPLIEVKNLKMYFDISTGVFSSKPLKAVDDVSFSINKGETLGLVGESGCGKTTTGRSIIRLHDITGGSVYFDGKRIAAGTRRYKEAIKVAKAQAEAEKKQYKEELIEAIKNGEDEAKAQEEYKDKCKESTERLI